MPGSTVPPECPDCGNADIRHETRAVCKNSIESVFLSESGHTSINYGDSEYYDDDYTGGQFACQACGTESKDIEDFMPKRDGFVTPGEDGDDPAVPA